MNYTEDYIEDEIIDDILSIPQDEEEKKAWRIENDGMADWALNKIYDIKKEYSRKEMVAKNKIQQVEEWLQKQKDNADSQITFFEEKLQDYYYTLPEDVITVTKTQKQYRLPSGTIKVKIQNPEYIRNDDALLGWVKSNNLPYLKIKESVDWENIKKEITVQGDKAVYKKTGEVIEGITINNRDSKFVVDV